MDKKRKETYRRLLTDAVGGLLVIVAMTLLAMLFAGCRTVEQVTDYKSETARRDTVHVYTERRDSVVYRDSVFVHVYTQGDTVHCVTERWNVRWSDRVRVDTVYRVADYKSTTAERKTEVVEKKPSLMERTGRGLVEVLAAVGGVCIAVWVMERRKKLL